MSHETASHAVLHCRIGYSIFGILIGAAVVLALLVGWELDSNHRFASVAYAGFSGAIAGWNLILHIMHLQDLWRTWLKGLRFFHVSGSIFACISILSCIVFLIVAAIKHEDITVDSFYITAIVSAWCAIWSVLLIWHSKKYKNEFADLSPLLDF